MQNFFLKVGSRCHSEQLSVCLSVRTCKNAISSPIFDPIWKLNILMDSLWQGEGFKIMCVKMQRILFKNIFPFWVKVSFRTSVFPNVGMLSTPPFFALFEHQAYLWISIVQAEVLRLFLIDLNHKQIFQQVGFFSYVRQNVLPNICLSENVRILSTSPVWQVFICQVHTWTTYV